MTTATKSTHHVSARVAGIRFLFSTHTLQTALDTVLFDHYRKKLLSGSVVNASEQRAAWHTEFRNPQPCQLVQDSLAQIKQISDSIRQHQWFFDVKDIVNIGIGGSDLGPKLICEAFEDEITQFTLHFVSNLDKAQIHSTLKKLSPAQTLFIVTSKSFRTTETIENMLIAKQWLLEAGCDPAEHLIAVTTNIHIATEIYQIPVSRVLMMPDWIGGRFSLWCAVGLPCAIALGFEKFSELHQGAYEMDMHFLQTSSEKNAPVMYASLLCDAIMNHSVQALAILPYAYRLRSLPDYLRQLLMESLGKHVTTMGESVAYPTGPIVYGSAGTNSQHSFQQLMMQGTHPVFADFILPLTQANMIANCVTQVKTLRDGIASSDPLKQIPGGKIANLFVLEKLNLKSVGALLAFYEHAVVTTAFMLNINPFDQFGVEHAKCHSESLLKHYGGEIHSIEQIKQILD
ncbi:MAG: hypothetical protein A3C44_07425 [Gammaproteobacteria bacterium RIFCSPHIGHO2_02_FULL_39_13]|nr:MAG: hypothetical protein A3C44_07425 [Gammaproteobacteria bacterium RIFCSPHIGHO2_02_FULL_39_13]